MKFFERFRPFASALCVTGFFLWANAASAAVLVEYEFGTNLATATYDPTLVGGGLSVSAIAAAPSGINGAGSGWGTGSGGNTYGISTSSGDPVNSLFTRGPVEASEADAYDMARYFSLTLTPDGGTQMSLTSLSFDYYRESSTSNDAFFLRTDAGGDNFSTTIASGTLTGSSSNGWQPTTVDLSGVASLQNLTEAVTVQIYVYGSAADTRITRYDNLTFNGDITPVPEPGTGLLTLAGLGVLSIAGRFRTKRTIVG